MSRDAIIILDLFLIVVNTFIGVENFINDNILGMAFNILGVAFASYAIICLV